MNAISSLKSTLTRLLIGSEIKVQNSNRILQTSRILCRSCRTLLVIGPETTTGEGGPIKINEAWENVASAEVVERHDGLWNRNCETDGADEVVLEAVFWDHRLVSVEVTDRSFSEA